jgi:hypothetical protein
LQPGSQARYTIKKESGTQASSKFKSTGAQAGTREEMNNNKNLKQQSTKRSKDTI